MLFIAEHWFPTEKYYLESRYYYCCSKLEKRVSPFKRGLGGLILMISDELRPHIERVDYSKYHHVKVTLSNNIRVVGVYWRKSLEEIDFVRSLNDISECDILIGDINMTLIEIETTTNNLKINRFKEFLVRNGLKKLNNEHRLNKLDHIFLKDRHYNSFSYNYYSWTSDHPLVELKFKEGLNNDPFVFKKPYFRKLVPNYYNVRANKTQACIKMEQEILDFVKLYNYPLIIKEVEAYDSSLSILLERVLTQVCGYRSQSKLFKEKKLKLTHLANSFNNKIKPVKVINKLKINQPIVSRDSSKEVLSEVCGYYKDIFCKQNRSTCDDLDSDTNMLPISYPKITLSELKTEIKDYSSRKTPGVDGITKEIILVFIDTKLIDHYLNLFNLCWFTGTTPQRWNTAVVHPIPKTKDAKYIDEYRPLSMTIFLRRIFENIIKHRVFTKDFINKNISIYQTGFRSNYNCSNQVIYLNDSFKLDRLNIKLFIDLKNAYDSVDIDRLLIKLSKMVDAKIIDLISSLFLKGKITVKVNDSMTSYIHKTNGLLQGSILSPMLFNIYINELCEELNKENSINKAIFYADDLVLISETKKDLRIKLNKIQSWCNVNNIEINEAKSGIIGSTFMVHNGGIIDEVKRYKYLGIWFDYHGMIYQDMIEIIKTKAKDIISFANNTSCFLSEEEKIHIFKAYILPYFNFYGPLYYFSTLREPRKRAGYVSEINQLNKDVMNWIFGCNTKQYSILNSISGVLHLKDLIRLISIRFKYKFNLIQEPHPITELQTLLKVKKLYNNKSLSYRIEKYGINGFENVHFKKDIHIFLKEVGKFKRKSLSYGVLGQYISYRLKNGMDRLIKIKNSTLRRRLLDWRRNKVYNNMVSIQTGKHFSRKLFIDEIYPQLQKEIDPKYQKHFDEERKNKQKNFTMIDYLINKKEYRLACWLIESSKAYLKIKAARDEVSKIRDDISEIFL